MLVKRRPKGDETYRRTWTLPGRLRDFLIVRNGDLREEDEIVLDPLGLAADIDLWLDDPVHRRTLIEIYESTSLFPLTQTVARTGAEIARYLKPRLEQIFLDGTFFPVRLPKTLRSWGEPGEIPETQVERVAAVQPELTWTAIQLIDDRGQPVPSEQYSLELPDGSIRNGSLDGEGQARADGIPHGQCKVSFPRIDGREWHPA